MEQKKFILVVDDDPVIGKAIEGYLTDKGYKVMVSEDGYDVLVICEEFLPDMILSDIKMPKLDGITLLEALKNNSKTKHIPVVFMSAYREDDLLQKAVKLGAEHFLFKPFPLDALEYSLSKILGAE